jgi:hypothetical protein
MTLGLERTRTFHAVVAEAFTMVTQLVQGVLCPKGDGVLNFSLLETKL